MSRTSFESTDKVINFLDSAVGLVKKTTTVSATGVTADEHGYKVVPAGTPYPANDGTAKGILFEAVDVTDGDHEGSLLVAGRVLEDCLPVTLNSAAKTALEAVGIKFFESTAVVRA